MIPDAILWLLPLLFVVHDTEEAVWLPAWLDRNRERLERRFPTLAHRLYGHFGRLSRRTFAFMAAEEFFIILAVTLYASITDDYTPWLALLLAFGLHLVVHVAQAVVVGGYLPSLVTSLVSIPVVVWILLETTYSRVFTPREYLFCAVAGVVVAAANLLLIHLVAARWARR